MPDEPVVKTVYLAFPATEIEADTYTSAEEAIQGATTTVESGWSESIFIYECIPIKIVRRAEVVVEDFVAPPVMRKAATAPKNKQKK